MRMLKMCLNWKVLAGLAVVGVGIYAVAPDLAVAALPFLVLAICPLSMLFMMKGMQGDGDEGDEPQSPEMDAGLTRDERLARLRTEQTNLAEQISALEREDFQPPRTVRSGRVPAKPTIPQAGAAEEPSGIPADSLLVQTPPIVAVSGKPRPPRGFRVADG